MAKTYKVITIETVDIDIQNCVDVAVDAIKEYLFDTYDIDYDKHEKFFPELMKDIIENLKKTYWQIKKSVV